MEKEIGEELGQQTGEREVAWYMMTENAKNKVELIENIFIYHLNKTFWLTYSVLLGATIVSKTIISVINYA